MLFQEFIMKQININPAIELLKIQMVQMGDLISQAQAARILAYSPQYITKLIKNGILTTYTVAGRKCLSRAEVLPDLGGIDESQEAVPVSRYFRKRSSREFDGSLAD